MHHRLAPSVARAAATPSSHRVAGRPGWDRVFVRAQLAPLLCSKRCFCNQVLPCQSRKGRFHEAGSWSRVLCPSDDINCPCLAPFAPPLGYSTASERSASHVASNILSRDPRGRPHAANQVSLETVQLVCNGKLPRPSAPPKSSNGADRCSQEIGLCPPTH